MESLGPYHLVRRIGGGGMGVVHEAWDTRLERPVALKVISPQLADDPGFRARFTREARAQAALDSEHVVRVYAHGEDDGRLWIATQLLPDGDLGALLRRYGALPVPVALDLVGQVADGLAAAHAAGLVHRDIKPANVLLRRGPRIHACLADFGIARPLGAEVTATGTAGTPAYQAPELHTGGAPGVATDVYALGCLLWAGLTGAAPYAGGSDFEVATAHRERPVPQLPGRDPRTAAVNRVLRTALAKRPQDRRLSAAAFRDALTEAARLPDEPARPRRWRVAGPAVAAVVLVVVVGTLWAVTRSDGDPAPPSGPASPRADAPQLATDELAGSLTGTMARSQADCVASYVVDDLGFDALVDAGFFTADGHFLDPDLADEPEIRRSLTRAAQSCFG
ncbi:serine/threonine-protein kinase [Nocardioides sp.]|uniref:serine/threonine-protein kinase n=1 Tax=Nocardioides sp. TaxID=35761 RepID=UPI003783294B